MVIRTLDDIRERSVRCTPKRKLGQPSAPAEKDGMGFSFTKRSSLPTRKRPSGIKITLKRLLCGGEKGKWNSWKPARSSHKTGDPVRLDKHDRHHSAGS
jgi:hypothetical protein